MNLHEEEDDKDLGFYHVDRMRQIRCRSVFKLEEKRMELKTVSMFSRLVRNYF